ncbi:hypothetical protein ACXM0N_09985 [Peribacillus simplex]
MTFEHMQSSTRVRRTYKRIEPSCAKRSIVSFGGYKPGAKSKSYSTRIISTDQKEMVIG